jgi:hypothetical protein
MAALTRRRSEDHREECWHVYYGDVHVGTIAIRVGVPHHEDPWGWICGFYPGSEPGEYTDGTAVTFDQRRAASSFHIGVSRGREGYAARAFRFLFSHALT